MLSALLGLSTQSVIVPAVRYGAFSRAAVEHHPQLILADPANWYGGVRPSYGFTVSRIGAFSRAAVEQHPQLILADPTNWYTTNEVPKGGIFSRAAVESPPQLILTNPANWFSALTPAEGFTLPTFPPVLNFLSGAWNIRPSTADLSVTTVTSSTVAPTTTEPVVASTTETPSSDEEVISTEAPVVFSETVQVSTTIAPISNEEPVTPELRLPVSTRAPGVPHHFKDDDDNVIRYEISNGIHKISSNRESFEIHYTNRDTVSLLKSVPDSEITSKAEVVAPEDEIRLDTPVETPVSTSVQQMVTTPVQETVAPPLIHSSNTVEQSSTAGVPSTNFILLNYLSLPAFPAQPFLHTNALISRIQALPSEGRYARTFVTVA